MLSTKYINEIDYCNSLLAGCPRNLICKLQKVQNNDARLICLTTYLQSFVLYTGFLSNPVFSTELLFLSLNQRTAKPRSIYPVSSSCMFHLANSVCLLIHNSFLFHPLTSSRLVNMSSSFLLRTLNAFPLCVQLCVCVCTCVCWKW